jgi:hypothetical protein
MADKYEYLVVDQDLRGLTEAQKLPENMPQLLNIHGARGWMLDRFWDTEDGVTRVFLFRKATVRSTSLDSQVRRFTDLATSAAG